jgi:hypothetical protein
MSDLIYRKSNLVQTPYSYGNMELYTDANPDNTIKVGFKNKLSALESIEKINKKTKPYQIKVIITLYYRAKFHPYQTKNMRDAMNVFKKWLKTNSPTSLD